MFKFLIRSFLTANVIKSVLRHAILLAGGALGYQAVMHGQDVDLMASALFSVGATAWGWYDAHQHAAALANARRSQTIAAIAMDQRDKAEAKIVLGQPTEEQVTAMLNRQQLNPQG